MTESPKHDQTSIKNLNYQFPPYNSWPFTIKQSIDDVKIKLNDQFTFHGSIKNGQIFGPGYVISSGIFDETVENDEKTPSRIDSGIWRGYRLLYLEKTVPKLELLDQAINYIHDEIPQKLNLPVFDQISDKNDRQIIFSAPNWEISAISINAGDNQDNQNQVNNSCTNSITGPNTSASLTFLNLAQSKDKKESLYELLQNKKVDVNVADSKGYTALMIASTLSFDPELVDFLIDHGANVNQTLKEPNTPFHSLKICLSIYYHNFRIRHILNRIIDVGEKILPVIKDKRYANDGSRLQKSFNTNTSVSSNFYYGINPKTGKNEKMHKSKLHLEKIGGDKGSEPTLSQEQKEEQQENELRQILPELIFEVTRKINKNTKRKKLRSIIEILIRRGSKITKFLLALIILTNDLKLLETVDQYGKLESAEFYTNYHIDEYNFNILHLCSLAKFNSAAMMKILIKQFPSLDVNSRVTKNETQTIASNSLSEIENSASQILSETSFSTLKSPRNNLSNSKNYEEPVPNQKFIGCRPIDLAILRKEADIELIKVLSIYTNQYETCPIYRADSPEAQLNFIQLMFAVLDTKKAREVILYMQNYQKEKGGGDDEAENYNKLTVDQDLFTLFNIMDIQFSDLRKAGDADKRLALVDEILRLNPKLSLCMPLESDNFPSKIITDFAYHQFYKYTKSKYSLSSLDKQDRVALHENKLLIRGLCQRFRPAGYKVLSNDKINEKVMKHLDEADSKMSMAGILQAKYDASQKLPSKEAKALQAKLSIINYVEHGHDIHEKLSDASLPNSSVGGYDQDFGRRSTRKTVFLKNSNIINSEYLLNNFDIARFTFEFCYECCRSMLSGSAGKIESLKPLEKLTTLDREIYYCGSYCRNKICERLKAAGYLINILKNKSYKALNRKADLITSKQIADNTGLSTSGLLTGQGDASSSLMFVDNPEAKNLHPEKLKNNSKLDAKKTVAVRRITSPGNRQNVYLPASLMKDISVLSLRNERFLLPKPLTLAQSSISKMSGLENYSYN